MSGKPGWVVSIRERHGTSIYDILPYARRRAGGQNFLLPENLLKSIVTR